MVYCSTLCQYGGILDPPFFEARSLSNLIPVARKKTVVLLRTILSLLTVFRGHVRGYRNVMTCTRSIEFGIFFRSGVPKAHRFPWMIHKAIWGQIGTPRVNLNRVGLSEWRISFSWTIAEPRESRGVTSRMESCWPIRSYRVIEIAPTHQYATFCGSGVQVFNHITTIPWSTSFKLTVKELEDRPHVHRHLQKVYPAFNRLITMRDLRDWQKW